MRPGAGRGVELSVACFDDSTIASLLDPQGQPPPAFDAHLDECGSCRTLVGAVMRTLARAPDGALSTAAVAPGDRVGRYILLNRLGEGAGGVVYSAHDPDLDRRVAVKMLAQSVDPRDDVKLLEEARAMAKVTHPNVVRVYDAGRAAGSVFVAMELLPGGTLRTWAARPRSWRSVLARYREAGLGLAAAHARGLVHRDFKPENVLLAEDGRACVADFGLASVMASSNPAAADESSAATDRGAGTPRYMAPEAHRRDDVDALADQFSFCAALFEALYRRPAFQGDSVADFARAKARGTMNDAGRAGPRVLRAVLATGLRPEPHERHASMEALLEALERVASRRRRRVVVASLLGAVVATASLTAWVAQPSSPDCPDPDAALAGVWDASREGAVRDAAARSVEPGSRAMIEGAMAQLGRYAARWGELQRTTCRAKASGVLTAAEAREREACLALRLAALDGLGQQLLTLDARALERVSAAAWSLPDVEECADADAPVPPPSGLDILQALQRQRGAVLLGRFEDAAAAVERLREEARARGDVWTAGEAGADLCWIRSVQAEPAAEREACEAAAYDSLRGRNDHAATRTWIRLIEHEGEAGRNGAAEVYDDLAKAAVELLGDSRLAADLESARAGRARGRSPVDALVHGERALALEIEGHGREEHPEVASRMIEVALLRSQATGEHSLAELERARQILLATEGEHSLTLARVYLVEATQLEDPEAAIAALERATEITERVAGSQAVRTYLARANLAMLRSEKQPDQVERALAELREALDGLERVGAGADPATMLHRLARARMLHQLDRLDEAVEACRDATERMESFHGPRSYMMAMSRGVCASIYAEAGRLEDARDEYQASLDLTALTLGKDHPKYEAVAASLDELLARIEAEGTTSE